ncbi:MAG: riboflavin biosynthesis protein RibF [Bacteroidales bacterium]|nr:riboflavin biosynthesis protein RibF [Bacteroidales bacterium]
MAIVATTGFFDGVHPGHRQVLSALVQAARTSGGESLVVTFWPHPRTVLQQDAAQLKLLTSIEEKKELLLGAGVDRVEVIPFSRELSSMTACEYIRDVLKGGLGVSTLVAGYDNRLGCDHLQQEDLREVVESLGMEYVPVKRLEGPSVSSTLIRRTIADGDVEQTAVLLGRLYSLRGVVVTGNKIGRTMGFPTANLALYEPLKAVPANGVYKTSVSILGRSFTGLTNIGLRPTVGKNSAITIETHILDFDEDIYGLPMEVSFISRIRDERSFPSLEELKEQIEADIETVR